MKTRHKEMLKRGLIVVPVVCALIVVGVLKGSKKGPEKLPVTETSRNVRTLVIQPMDVIPRVVGYGVVEPDKVWQVVPQVSGRIILTSPVFGKGHFAGKGELFITLDPTDYELGVAQAEAEIRTIRAGIAEIDKQELNTERLLEIQHSLLVLKKKEMERNQTARKTRVISETVLDRARMDYQAQRIQVQDLENALNLIPTTRQSLESQLDLNRVRLVKARVDLDRTRIRVPFNCRITEILAEAGQYVQAGQILARADGTDRVEMTAQVALDKMTRLFPDADGPITSGGFDATDPVKLERLGKCLGLKVSVSLVNDGFDTKWDADFARAGATMDPQTRTMGIIVVVEKPYEKIIPGLRPALVRNMFCEVEITGPPLVQRIVIPRSALHEDTVYVVDPENRLVRRSVRVEFSQDDFYLLKSGLGHGEQIVVSDLTPAMDGMLLAPTEDKALDERLRTQACINTH